MNAEAVEAAGDLWPLGLVLVLIIAIVLFRNQLRKLLDRLTRFSFKHGETQFDVDTAQPEPENEQASDSEQEVPPSPAPDPDPELLREVEGNEGSDPEGEAEKSVIDLLKAGEIEAARAQFLKPSEGDGDDLTQTPSGEDFAKKEAVFLALAFVYAHDESAHAELRSRAESGPGREKEERV